MFTYNCSNVDAVLSCVKNSLLIVMICWQMWRMNMHWWWENPQCLEVLFNGENAACMKVFQARLKFWNIELSWFDTSAGETSINNRRSWIFRKCMLWLTCNLKKVQYTNKAVMIAQHQRWKRARKPPCISLYVLFLNWGMHMTALSRKPEQSGWCLSSLYWQLLSNKEGVVIHTLRFSVLSFPCTFCFKLLQLQCWKGPLISLYHHHYVLVFTWVVYIYWTQSTSKIWTSTPHEVYLKFVLCFVCFGLLWFWFNLI